MKLATIVVSLFVLTGCGGKQDSKKEKTATAKNETTSKDRQNPNDNENQSKKQSSTESDNQQAKNRTSPKHEDGQKKTVVKKADVGIPKAQAKKTIKSANPKSSENREVAKKNETKDDSQIALQKLNQQVAGFQVPPAWLQDVKTKWDVARKPWKEGRIEIRRLLGLNTEEARREGIKLTWDYLQKNDIGDKHEYGMYMFLGGEPIWAVIAYRERLAEPNLNYPPFFGVIALASLYSDFGAFEEAEKVLQKGVKMRPRKKEWYEMREAEMHDALGDLYVAWGKIDQAKSSYREAIRLYPLGKPPYGRHLLPRRAKKVQTKLDLLSAASLGATTLKNGTYRETALGYSGDIKLSVQVANGKIARIGIQHQEKIDQNACKIIPQRIVEKQSLTVDGISGATITKDAIVAGTLRALRKAGLN